LGLVIWIVALRFQIYLHTDAAVSCIEVTRSKVLTERVLAPTTNHTGRIIIHTHIHNTDLAWVASKALRPSLTMVITYRNMLGKIQKCINKSY
jgi:hypothetical protein